MKESDPHRPKSRRLIVIGIALICVGLVALAMHFAFRNALRNMANDLATQIDTIAARLDAVRDKPDGKTEVAAISAKLSDAAQKLAHLKDAYNNPSSYSNMCFMAYVVLTIVGSGFIMAGSVRRWSTRNQCVG